MYEVCFVCVLMMWSDCGCRLAEGLNYQVDKLVWYKYVRHMIQRLVFQGCPTLSLDS